MTTREDDGVENMFICSTHEYIMMFSNFGRMYRIKAYEIPEGSRTGKGMNIVNVLPLMPEEEIISILPVGKDLTVDSSICMITEKGIMKRTALDAFRNVRKTGIIAINIDEDDRLKFVAITNGNDQLVVATKNGLAIRFSESDVREMGRTARGVRAIRLRENDSVVGLAVLKENARLLTVTENGYGRISSFDDYRLQSRGGKGITNYRCAKYNTGVAGVISVNDDEDIILISSDGIIIRIPVAEISSFSRPAKGVRVMRVGENGKVLSLATAEHDDEQVNAHAEEAEADSGEVEGEDSVEDTEETTEE